jgi:hypothetical protein
MGTNDGNNNSSNASSGGTTVTDIQRFATNIYSFPSDKTFATYEVGDLQALPKSLFYDAATSDGVYRGLFAYYVLGKGSAGGPARYHQSETTENLSKITPIESRNPTAKMIIDVTSNITNKVPAYLDPASPYRGQIYNVKDFIFCKYYGIIPNNRMLTLRRFANPTLDSLRVIPNAKAGDFIVGADKKVKFETVDVPDLGRMQDLTARENTSLPVAQAVTYFGGDTGNSLNGILGISTGLNFTLGTQDPVKNEQTGDPGLMNSPYGDLIKSYVQSGTSGLDVEGIDKLVGTLLSPEKSENRLKRALLDEAVSAEGPLSKKIFVNVNTVNQMYYRAQGFTGGTDSFTINFDYTLSSVGQVNSKLLFLDLMTNLFSIGTDYGQFLSPELRLSQTSTGLGFPGGPAGYAKSIVDPIQYLRDTVSKMLSKSTVERQLAAEKSVSEEMSQMVTEIKNFANDPDNKPLGKDSKLYRSISVMLSDAFLRKVYYQPIMLSGYPVGEWHLVVGNPLNPIAMIGNLICTNVKIAFNDELGPDDFPTELKASFTLAPGRQRHRGDWESMFNRGNGRLYLGQLTSSGESTQAWINTSGVQVNRISSLDQVVTQGSSNLTGTETNRGN